MKSFKTGAKKDTTGKLPLHLVPPEVVEIFAKVTKIGIDKGYEPRNWEQGLPINEGHLAAAERHMLRYKKGEDLNIEVLKDGSNSNAHHLEHAAWHLMAAAVQINRHRLDLDDRIKDGVALLSIKDPLVEPERFTKEEWLASLGLVSAEGSFRIKPATYMDFRGLWDESIEPDTSGSF